MTTKRDPAQHPVSQGQQGRHRREDRRPFAGFRTAGTAAVGIGNSQASLDPTLCGRGLDIRDMRAGDKRPAVPNALDLNAFRGCPILGCYLLTCSDTSAVTNVVMADVGLPGWTDKVEMMKRRQTGSMRKIANKDITGSRLQLEGLGSDKGALAKKGFFAGIKGTAMKQVGLD